MSTTTIALISWIIGGPIVLYIGICIGSGAAERRRLEERRRIWRREQERLPQIMQPGRKVKV